MHVRRLRYLGLTSITLAMLLLPRSHAQTGTTRSAPDTSGLPRGAHASDEFSGFDNPTIRVQMQNARKIEQHKRLVSNADHLIELTKQLRAELQTRPVSSDDERRLDEIARLARSVKDQMAGR